MKYVIYSGLSSTEFDKLKNKLNSIEQISSLFMQTNQFYLNKDSYEDVLALDYTHKDSIFFGNIGLKYEENESSVKSRMFSFYILKAYDSNSIRFFKKEGLERLFALDQVLEDVDGLFGRCMSIYSSLGKDDLIEKINIRRLD